MVSGTIRVGARSCTVNDLDLQHAEQFITTHHSQGWATLGAQPHALGMYTAQGELIGVALFSNPRTSAKQREFSRELLRLCFRSDVRVPGGASKLIRHYMNNQNPYDLFTYQYTGGEVTDVYEKSGMSLVGPANPTKQILVKDGLTHLTAENNRCDWFSVHQAVTLGPDALLGTELGQDTGRSNIQLFLDLGYHLETVPGDRVYAWYNPNWTHYVYRIESSVDDGYYIGRRSIMTANATEQECLSDLYMGSGGSKFQRWVEIVGVSTLTKQIVGRYPTRARSISTEMTLIGDLYLTDPRCKNTIAGGLGVAWAGGTGPTITIATCALHGETKHQGTSCTTCRSRQSISTLDCPIHGATKHIGQSCMRCATESAVSYRTCEIHGENSAFMGESCIRCSVSGAVSIRECPEHGDVLFQGDKCATCSATSCWSLGTCEHHGDVLLQSGNCATCSAQESISIRVCDVHGAVKHKGDSCRTCSAKRSLSIRECDQHGLTTYRGTQCQLCMNQNIYLRECAVHGEVAHRGDTCLTCSVQGQVSMMNCDVHGITKHKRDKCCKCSADKMVHTRWHVGRDAKIEDCLFCNTGDGELGIAR